MSMKLNKQHGFIQFAGNDSNAMRTHYMLKNAGYFVATDKTPERGFEIFWGIKPMHFSSHSENGVRNEAN